MKPCALNLFFDRLRHSASASGMVEQHRDLNLVCTIPGGHNKCLGGGFTHIFASKPLNPKS